MNMEGESQAMGPSLQGKLEFRSRGLQQGVGGGGEGEVMRPLELYAL